MKIRRLFLGCFLGILLVSGCAEKDGETEKGRTAEQAEGQEEELSWQEAAHTPYGKYPELVTYTLGQLGGENNSNLPDGDTYEDNAYTRYLREVLQIQNEDQFREKAERYSQYVQVLVKDGTLPDVLMVNDRETLEKLVAHDMLEDLTAAYEECTSPRIKEMYQSYSGNLLETGTFDGKLLALPETVIDHGPCLLWLRKDWMEELGLEEPKSLEDAYGIVQAFVENRMGCEEGEEPVGLLCDPGLVGNTSSNYSMDPVFTSFGAHPQRWMRNEEGKIVYGSLTEEVRESISFLRKLYREGILDQSFALRQQNNLRDLVINGKCGAFFGLWWTPNNPLMEARDKDPTADWQPFYLTGDRESADNVFASYADRKYVVVRKGYEHPEIVMKIVSVLFDYSRFEAEDADEVNEYFALNVDPTARPLVINVDYNDATYQITKEIREVLAGEKSEEEISAIARSYYEASSRFLREGEKASSMDWAAYTSRLSAVGLLVDEDYEPPSYEILNGVDGNIPDYLLELETKAFLQIILGKKPISYFDKFVEEWYEQGGAELTALVQQSGRL